MAPNFVANLHQKAQMFVGITNTPRDYAWGSTTAIPRLLGVEPTGAAKITESLRAGRVVELAAISTAANTLAPRRSDEMNFAIIRETVSEVVLVTDEQMLEAARWLWFDAGIAAELSGAAAVAALASGRIALAGVRSACAIVCGAGTDGLS